MILVIKVKLDNRENLWLDDRHMTGDKHLAHDASLQPGPGGPADTGHNPPAIKTKSGRWQSGVSGNPNGRPKSTLEARFACRQLNERTLAVLVELLDDEDGDLRYKAACRIRDEANGKPIQAIRVAAEDEQALEALDVEQLMAIATGKPS